MKFYQERWLAKLNEAKNKKDIEAVCKEIIKDDTGGTDALTQSLAKKLVVYLQK